jgi:hypothetical protein
MTIVAIIEEIRAPSGHAFSVSQTKQIEQLPAGYLETTTIAPRERIMPSARYPSNYSSYDHGSWGSLVTAQASIRSMNPTLAYIHDSTVAARNRKK